MHNVIVIEWLAISASKCSVIVEGGSLILFNHVDDNVGGHLKDNSTFVIPYNGIYFHRFDCFNYQKLSYSNEALQEV